MTWVRFKEAQPSRRDFHIVSAVESGSIFTACRGSCSLTDLAEMHDSPPEERRCGACRQAIGEMGEPKWNELIESIREAEKSGVA